MSKETPVFFDNAGQNMFGIFHQPDSADFSKAIVICHSFAEEKLWAHRVLVNYARQLTDMGYMVLRFDYRGYGDSDGEFSNCTLTTYKEDIIEAVNYVRKSYPQINSIGLLGHRLGASIALECYDDTGVKGPLILWDPILDGDKYMQDFLRSNLTTQLAVYGEIRETREKLVQRMQSGDLINIEGYDLSYAQFESVSQLKLNKKLSNSDFTSLVVQVGRTEKTKKSFEEFSNIIGSDICCVVEDPFWKEIKRFYNKAPNIYKATSDWLGER